MLIFDAFNDYVVDIRKTDGIFGVNFDADESSGFFLQPSIFSIKLNIQDLHKLNILLCQIFDIN